MQFHDGVCISPQSLQLIGNVKYLKSFLINSLTNTEMQYHTHNTPPKTYWNLQQYK